MKRILFSVLLMNILINIGCAVDRQTENYNMTTVADLNLTVDSHPHGFTKSACFSCHLPQNIHQVDHFGAPSFTLARPMVDAYGLASCSGCHGTNGVTP